jgi:hypothetical protein
LNTIPQREYKNSWIQWIDGGNDGVAYSIIRGQNDIGVLRRRAGLFVANLRERRAVERLSRRIANKDGNDIGKMKRRMLLSHEHNHTNNNRAKCNLINDLLFTSP